MDASLVHKAVEFQDLHQFSFVGGEVHQGSASLLSDPDFSLLTSSFSKLREAEEQWRRYAAPADAQGASPHCFSPIALPTKSTLTGSSSCCSRAASTWCPYARSP